MAFSITPSLCLLCHTLSSLPPHHLAPSLVLFSLLARHLQLFFLLDRMLCCIIRAPLNRHLFSLQAVDSSRNRLFPGKTGAGQEVVEERMREGGGGEREKEGEGESFVLWREPQGESNLCQIECVCTGSRLFVAFEPREYEASVKICKICMRLRHVKNSKTVSSPLSLHLTSPTTARHALTHMAVLSILWAWHSSAGRECREGQRETERRRAKKNQ